MPNMGIVLHLKMYFQGGVSSCPLINIFHPMGCRPVGVLSSGKAIGRYILNTLFIKGDQNDR